MRILLLAPHPFYQERGTPIAVDLLLRTLAGDGHTVDALTYHEGADRAYGDGVRIHRIAAPPFARGVRPGFSAKKLLCDARMMPAALRLARATRCDVVHAVEESVFMAMRIRRRLGVPYIYDMDSSMAQQLVEACGLLAPLRGFFETCEARAIRGAAAVAPMCERLAELARTRGAARVTVLHDVPLVDPAAAPAGDAGLPDLPRPRFMYIGNLEPYQGVDLLLEAFARYARQGAAGSLVIVGGADAHVAAGRREAKRLGLADRALVAGPRPLGLMGALFAQADVLVSPRRKGVNTPMKIYSYLLSGKPVLATDIVSHTQVLDNEVALLAAPDPDALTAAMRRLADDAALGARLAAAARRRVQERYSLASFTQRVRELYGSVAVRSDGSITARSAK